MYSVQLIERNDVPLDYIEDYLQHELLKGIGGLKQFNGKKVVFDIAYHTQANCDRPDSSIYGLSVNLTLVETKNFVDIHQSSFSFESKKSRWERFKQFVKGE